MRQVVAVLGVGGGALPVCLHAQLPATHVDAVELSPGVAAAARAHFGLVPDQVNPLATGLASLTCALSEESHLTSLTSLSLSLSLSLMQRLRLHVADAAAFIKESAPGRYDAVLIDCAEVRAKPTRTHTHQTQTHTR
jgi:spermidine synthase